MNRIALCLLFTFLAGAVLAQEQAPIVSPEVHSDNTVTFRLRMPNAIKVTVGLEGTQQPAEMTKDNQGVWSYTTPVLQPDYYGYEFFVDGAFVLDPGNPLMKPNLLFKSNMVHVPGQGLS